MEEEQVKNKEKKAIYKKWWFWVIIVVIVIIIIGSQAGSNDNTATGSQVANNTSADNQIANNNTSADNQIDVNNNTAAGNQTDTSNNTTTGNQTDNQEPPKSVFQKLLDLIDEGKLAFDTGDYSKGDIPKGEYAFVRIGDGQYYCEKDIAGNIIDNENFSSFGYVKVNAVGNITTRGLLVNIKTFKDIGVKGAKELYELINDQPNYDQAGMYKIGSDLAAGTYKLKSIGSGYYAIKTGPVGGNNKIVNNGSFSGNKSVTVTKRTISKY